MQGSNRNHPEQTAEKEPLMFFLYEQVIQNSPDLISIVDRDYVYRLVNNAYLRRYRKAEEEIVGHHASEVMGDEVFKNAVKPHFNRCLSGHEVRYQEWFSYPGLGDRHMDVSYYPMKNTSGSVEYVTVTVRDITELKRREESLGQSEKRLRALVEVLGDSVYELDRSLNYSHMSPQSSRITGHTPEDLRGKTPFDFMPPHEAVRLFDFVQERREIPLPFRGIENIVTHKDGRQIYLETSAVPIYNTEDEFSGYLCIDRDITDRKQAELQLRKREDHLNSILETSLDGMVVTSADRRIVYGNRALAAMYGYKNVSELIDTATDSYFAPESYPILSWIRERLDKGETIEDVVEFKGKRRNGSTFDAELRVGSFFEGGRRLDVAVIRDVTERKRMEYQLNQSSKLAAVGELATGVAHEVNNPLAAIGVYVGLLDDVFQEIREEIGDSHRAQVHTYIWTIEQQIERCRSLTNNLLSFTRTPQIEERNFDINELLRETTKMVSSVSLADTDISLNFDCELPPYRGIPNLLQQVFVNLLTNAFKATGPEGRITISTRLDDAGDIKIEFTDSGHGMKEEIKERIFEPFFTTRSEGEGTGLGLSISYYIIKQMNGKISVESAPGRGSKFVVTLPAADKATGGRLEAQ